MKITLYTITDCPFSKQEKEYLKSHSLAFEEKNLESNKEFLTEMLAISNNFAGTPVTKVEKDDGQISILKGFTKDEFDKTLEFTTQPANQVTSQPGDQSIPVSPPPAPEPPKPVSPVPPPSQPVVPPVVEPPKPFQPVTPPVTPPSQPASPKNDQLEALLANLQSKAATPPPVPNSAPSIPNFQ